MHDEYYQLQLFSTEKTCSECGGLKPASEYRNEHRRCLECRRKYSKRHYRENKARYQELNKRWRENNPDNVKEIRDRWRKENREHHLAYKRKQAKEKPEVWARDCRKRRARKLNAPGDGATLSELVAVHGTLCYLCRTEKATEVDHVVPLSKGGTNYPDNLRPACGSCNKLKGAKMLDEYLKGIK